MPPPKREYNAVPAIADEICQYRTGGSLTIFNKDHDTAEEGRSRTAEVVTDYRCTAYHPAYHPAPP
jgi:hypothetical protein